MEENAVSPDGDPVENPITDEYVDENGNTVVVGYPGGETVTVPVEAEDNPNGPGIGIGVEPPEGEGA